MTTHDAAPEFLEHLAWQTRTALRREERFARPASAPLPSWTGRLRTLALILISVFGGAATVVASEHLQGLREQELLLAGVELRLETSGLRLAHAHEELEQLRALHDSGIVSDAEVDRAKAERAMHEEELERLQLEHMEILATGRPVRDDLAAPLVAGRDFVSERLQLSGRSLHVAMDAAHGRFERAKLQHANGLVSQDELEAARFERNVAERDIDRIEQLLGLRRAHLSGATSSEQVELMAMRIDVQARARLAEQRIQHSRGASERIQIHADAGLVSSSEVRRAQIELREAEAEFQLTQLELARIQERLGQ